MSIMGAPVNMDSEHAAVRTIHQSDGVKVYDDYLFLYFVLAPCTSLQERRRQGIFVMMVIYYLILLLMLIYSLLPLLL
jgi:hypothetical protein